jgi:hypothetical protein
MTRSTQMIHVTLAIAAVFLFAQPGQTKGKGSKKRMELIQVESAQISFDGSFVSPKEAERFLSRRCDGRSVCREPVEASDFGREGILSSLTVLFNCGRGGELFEFEIDNESGRNEGSSVRLNCHRAPEPVLGDESSIVVSFASSVASHLVGQQLSSILFPTGIDQVELAKEIQLVVEEDLKEQDLMDQQAFMNEQLSSANSDNEELLLADGGPDYDVILGQQLEKYTTSTFVNDIGDTEANLRILSADSDPKIQMNAFTGYIAAASTLIGVLEYTQELANRSGETTNVHVNTMAEKLGERDDLPVVQFAAEIKQDMVYENITRTNPSCFRVSDTAWGFNDCNGTLHKAGKNQAEWDFDTCSVDRGNWYVTCAEQALPDVDATMGWVDQSVDAWRQSLSDAAALLPSGAQPCLYCAQAFNLITIDVFQWNWDKVSPPQQPDVLAEARCNGLNQCDVYLENGDIPGHDPGQDTSSNKNHVTTATVLYFCATDPPGTLREYQTISGVDTDSGGAWLHLDCAAPPTCTNPTQDGCAP